MRSGCEYSVQVQGGSGKPRGGTYGGVKKRQVGYKKMLSCFDPSGQVAEVRCGILEDRGSNPNWVLKVGLEKGTKGKLTPGTEELDDRGSLKMGVFAFRRNARFPV